MIDVTIDPVLTEKISDFKIAAIQYTDITVGDSPQMLRGRLHLYQESLYFDLLEKELSDFPGIKEWRRIFKMAGTDPSRYRHSAESLYRRIKKQNYLPSIQSAADMNNLYSLQTESPIGIYDLDRISGSISFTIGNEDDQYEGINERINKMNGLILTKDGIGPFGSPYVDSKRTMVTKETKNAIQFLYLRPSLTHGESEGIAASLMESFIKVNGGLGELKILG